MAIVSAQSHLYSSTTSHFHGRGRGVRMHNSTTRGSSEAHAHTRACTNECRTANEAQSRREREEGDQLPALPHDDALAQGRGVTREGGREGKRQKPITPPCFAHCLREKKGRINMQISIYSFVTVRPSVCSSLAGQTDSWSGGPSQKKEGRKKGRRTRTRRNS